jgi:hypothetical protein
LDEWWGSSSVVELLVGKGTVEASLVHGLGTLLERRGRHTWSSDLVETVTVVEDVADKRGRQRSTEREGRREA